MTKTPNVELREWAFRRAQGMDYAAVRMELPDAEARRKAAEEAFQKIRDEKGVAVNALNRLLKRRKRDPFEWGRLECLVLLLDATMREAIKILSRCEAWERALCARLEVLRRAEQSSLQELVTDEQLALRKRRALNTLRKACVPHLEHQLQSQTVAQLGLVPHQAPREQDHKDAVHGVVSRRNPLMRLHKDELLDQFDMMSIGHWMQILNMMFGPMRISMMRYDDTPMGDYSDNGVDPVDVKRRYEALEGVLTKRQWRMLDLVGRFEQSSLNAAREVLGAAGRINDPKKLTGMGDMMLIEGAQSLSEHFGYSDKKHALRA